MAHTAFARTYRPQTFAEIVGQERVSVTLANAVERKRIAQSYLFAGPRGTGKTSTARILAKAVNCETGMTASPCGVCSTCLEIARSASLDVIEIDGASNRGIDNIRELRETVAFPPQKGRYKIYIIDEVHMLTNEAWNALLKTLEEPPEHVIFVFATTEPEKVLPTILSRCQRYDFRPIPVPEIVGRLRVVAEKESIPTEEAALELIARAADGGLRDALSILDQAVAFASAKVGEAHTAGMVSETVVTELLGRVGSDVVRAIADHIARKDFSALVQVLDEAEDSGRSLVQLAHSLIEYYREALLAEVGRPGGSPVPFMRIIDELTGALEKSRRSAQIRLHLEIALFRAARAYERKIQLETVLEKLTRLEELIAGGALTGAGNGESGSGSTGASGGTSREQSGPDLFGSGGQSAVAKEREPDLIEKDFSLSAPRRSPASGAKRFIPAEAEKKAEGAIKAGGSNHDAELEALRAEWARIIEALKNQKNISITTTAVLVDVEIRSVTEDAVTLAFPGTFHRDKLDRDGEAKAALAQALSDQLGRPVRLKLRLIEEGGLPSSGTAAKAESAVDPKEAAEILKREPIVKAAIEIFGGEIIAIKDAPSRGGGQSH